jgi:hypothetical protein
MRTTKPNVKRVKRTFAGVAVLAAIGVGGALGLVTSHGPSAAAQVSRPTYPTNARGETYGSASGARSDSQLPELISVRADNGQYGYITRSAFEGPGLSLQQVRALPRDAEGNFVAPSRVVAVYAQNGVTQVGVFTIVQGQTGPLTAMPARGG